MGFVDANTGRATRIDAGISCEACVGLSGLREPGNDQQTGQGVSLHFIYTYTWAVVAENIRGAAHIVAGSMHALAPPSN